MRMIGPGLAAAILLSGCGSPGSSSPVPASSGSLIAITVADIPMPTTAASVDGGTGTIATLAMGVGETVAALGAGARVIGRDEASDVPSIHSAQVMTKAHAVNAEQVIAARPDVVLVDEQTGPREAIDQIRSAGITVVTVPMAWSIGDIPARVRAVASAIAASPDAVESVLAQVPTAPPAAQQDRPKVAFLYLRGTSAIYLLGGRGSGADSMIAAAGGRDVGAEAGFDAFVPLTAEALAQLDPDVLLVMTKGLASVGGLEGLLSLPGVAQTTAGRNRAVVSVDDTLLLSFGPRTAGLVDALTRALEKLGSGAVES